MPNQPFQRATERFRTYGVDLNSPVDSVKPGYYPVLQNVRSYTDGVVQPRQGLTSINTVVASKTPVHSVRRLNDPVNSSWARIVGVGDTLAYGQAAFTQATYNGSNVAFDGNPLMMVPFRPDQAVVPFMYIAPQAGSDTGNGYLRQLKINRAGTVHQMGLPAPSWPPTVEAGAFQFGASSSVGYGTTNIAQDFQTNAAAVWTCDGTVFNNGGTPPVAVSRVNTTVSVLAYDSGSTGWCSVVPVAMTNIGPGCQLDFNTGAAKTTLVVHEVYPAIVAGTNALVASIIYDSDSAPANNTIATIQLDKAVKEVVRNVIVKINGINYRVLSTTLAADGTTSFRVQGTGTTILATQGIIILGTFRVYDPNTGTITTVGGGANGIVQNDIQFVSVASATGAGWLNRDGAIDLTVTNIASGKGRPLSDDDYIHLSLMFKQTVGSNALNLVTGGRIMLNCDSEAAPTYTKNYYQMTFSPNDLVSVSQPAGTQGQTPINSRTGTVARNILDRPVNRVGGRGGGRSEGDDFGPREHDPDTPRQFRDPNQPDLGNLPRVQTGTGDAQWHELRFRRGDLDRVGTDTSRGFNNINGFRLEISLQTTANIITVEVNSLTCWGTYPLDIGEIGAPYQYRWRVRSSVTGARSNYSPPNLTGVTVLRGAATITPGTKFTHGGSVASVTPEVDFIDFERFGGVLTNWTYVGSMASTSTSFTDIMSDDVAAALAIVSEGDTNYQPWVCRGAPITGAFSTLAGTMGTSTSNLDNNIVKGTTIRVARSDGSFIDTTIRRIVDRSLGNQVNVEFADSIGTSTSNVSYSIPEPLFTRTLPALWAWNNTGFACGDPNNPGALYWTSGNNLDSTQDVFWLDVTSPSEPLMCGCEFNGKNYIWSTERMFEIDQIDANTYIAIQIPGETGLASIYGLAVGERIWYVSRDGIYQTGGGDSISITDQTLKPLFVKEGNAGVAVNGFNPPDFTVPNKIRLSYYDGYLYFIYQDTGGNQRCLTYTLHAEKQGWWPDTFTPGVIYLYGEEGAIYTSAKPTSVVHSLLACGSDATTGKLYQITGTADGATAISCRLLTQYFDAQDRRAEKRWGDLIVDADPNNATLNLVACTNGSTSTGGQLSLAPASFTGAARAQQISDISAGADPVADYSRNMALEVSWSSTGSTPKLFLWEPAYTIRPEQTEERATTWDDAGVPQDKYFQGVEIDANTFGNTKTVVVEYDGATTNVGDTLTVAHTGRQTVAYAFRPPFIAHTVRLRPSDTGNWSLYGYKWYFQPESPLADRWQTQQITFGGTSFFHMREVYVTTMSTQNVSMTVTRTDDNSSTVYTIPTSSGLRLKQRVLLNAPASKGKAFTFTFSTTSTGGKFRLYKEETSIYVKPWASEEAYSNQTAFGGMTGQGNAPV